MCGLHFRVRKESNTDLGGFEFFLDARESKIGSVDTVYTHVTGG